MNYVRVGGYIPPQPIEDYNDLPNIPVHNQDLAVSGFTPVANSYYRHTGATTDTFTQGVIYLYNGTGYAALDGAAVNNGTLTIQKNGTNVATFGANQSSSVTANITVPTKASDIDALPISGGTITGNLTVGGNLTVNGTTTTVDSTTLQVKDKLIEVAHGNTTTLTTPAGLVAPKYDGTNSGALVFDSTGTAYVGDVTLKDGNIDVANSGLQPLATRTGLVGGNLVQYDSSALTLKDSGKKISDFATSVKVNDNTIAPSGGVIDLGTVLTDASKFATAAQGSNADSALTKANANATEISNIKNGTTKVKSAEHADTADSATSAGTADKVANGLTIANATFDGSKPLTIGTSGEHIEIMGGSAASPNRVSIGLKYGNLMPSSYNKVTIDGYGIVTAGENVDYAKKTDLPDVSVLMPKSGGTFTGEVKFGSTENFQGYYIKRMIGGLGAGTAYNNLDSKYKDGTYHRMWRLRFRSGSSFWGKIKVTLYGGYSSFNASGVMSKSITCNFNTSNIYNNVGCYDGLGVNVEQDFRISEAIWNATANAWEVLIWQKNLKGNNSPTIMLECWTTNETKYIKAFNGITAQPVELTQSTSYSAQKASSTGGTKTVMWEALPVYENPLGEEIATVAMLEDKQDKITSSNKLSSSLVDGLGAAAAKAVDTTISANSTSTNLPTSKAVEDRINAHSGIDKVGTVTGVKMNEATKNPSSGVVDLGTVLTDESKFATAAQGTKADNALPISGGELTGGISAPNISTGTAAANYFQSQKFRGEGNADTYYHAVDFGYAGHNQVDFHEYGGVYNFHQNTVGTADGGSLVGAFTPDGIKEGNQLLKDKYLGKSGGTVTGNLTVGGNLTINGTTTAVDSTTLKVSDKLIEVAHGNTVALTTPAGLVAPKYDGTNSGALVFDSTGTAYVGDVTLKDGNIDVAKSDLQPLATRDGLVGGNLVQYDSSALTLKDSGKKISDLALKTDLNSKANLSGGNTLSGNQVITGYLDIRGAAAEKHLKTRGIGGSDGNGNSSDLYLQYSSDYKTYFGKTGQSTLNADGSISINGKTAATIDQIPPAANDGTLTIQKNGETVGTFTANQKDGTTANITVPTKASDVNALSLDGGTIKKSKTIKMDASANSDGANLKWGTVNSKNPYIGYASDQVDGTFVVGSLLGTNYASGLAIGGGSGNLLWKGTKVATTSDIPNIVQSTGTSTSSVMSQNATTNAISGKLDKTTYEVNKTIDFGQDGVLYVGKFKVYDTNVTCEVTSTTDVTYSGKLVIATQNYVISQMTVYGDAANTVAPNFFIKPSTTSDPYIEVYFKPASWSKNVVHIYGSNIQAEPTDVCTNKPSIPSTATLKPKNALPIYSLSGTTLTITL